MASLTITIEVEGGNPVVTVKDSAGNEKKVTGLVLFGFSPTRDELYGFSWGEPGDASKAVVEVIARACNGGDSWMVKFYRSLLERFIRATGVMPANAKEVTPEEVLRRWDAEDKKKPAERCPCAEEKGDKKWN